MFDYKILCEENLHKFGHETGHLELLGGDLYSDSTHFIFELLQNAEDVLAKRVKFSLFPDRLEIWHDGTPFSADDVRGITQIANSSKQEYTHIGRFGLGFKSVYAITNAPEIHSGKFNFKIEKFIRPEQVAIKEISAEWTTLFILPLKGDKEEIFLRLTKRLENINMRTLLFLRNIEDIRWDVNGDKRKSGDQRRQINKNRFGFHQVSIWSNANREDWLLFKKEESFDGNTCQVSIAFSWDEDSQIVRKAENAKLSVFFPTEKESHLGFVFNGNFRTTPNRENIPPDDPHNGHLIEMGSALVVEAIQQIKGNKLLNISFLEALPIEKKDFSDGSIFCLFFKTVRDAFLKEEFLPTKEPDIFSNARDGVIAKSSELIELYVPAGKKWIDRNITTDKHPELYEYLTEILDVKLILPRDFIKSIEKPFLEECDDEWFKRFYRFLDDQKGLLRESNRILDSKPIIRLEDGRLVEPRHAFLPIKTTINFPMVKRSIAEDPEIRKILQGLGVRVPDPLDQLIEKITTKYIKPEDIGDDYSQDITEIASVFRADSEDAKKRLSEALKELRIVRCTDGIFRKISEVYVNNDLLRRYFKYADTLRCFADETLSPEDWSRIGIADLPRRIKIPDWPKNVEHKSSRSNSETERVDNYMLDGLDSLLMTISPESAILLAQIISSAYDSSTGFFDGTHYWNRYSHYQEKIKNNIYNLIIEEPWALAKDGKIYTIRELTTDELADEFAVIKELPLPFKPDSMKQIEKELEESGRCIVDKKAYEEYLQWKASNSNCDNSENNKFNKEEWTPQSSPAGAVISRGDIMPIPLDKSSGGTRAHTEHTKEALLHASITTEKASSPAETGKWAEAVVIRYLKEQEGVSKDDIQFLNENDMQGTGRDIVVVHEGKQLKVIEVKGTVSDSATIHPFLVSGKQWENARREDDLYWIYCVFGVGSETPKIVPIQNPIKKWKNGELEANPVNFVIRG